MRILVTGASGVGGSRLIPRLLADDHTVRALGREPQRVHTALARGGHSASVEVVRADVLTGAGLERGLADVQVAYYLIHSMERAGENQARASGGDRTAMRSFAERDRLAAERFAAAAARAGVHRIVYLGGLTGHDTTSERERD